MDGGDQRLSWLDRHRVDQDLAASVAEHPFDEVEVALRHAATQHQDVVLEAPPNHRGQELLVVGSDPQALGRDS